MNQHSTEGIPSYDSELSRLQYKLKSSWEISRVSVEFKSNVSEIVSDSAIRVDVKTLDDVELFSLFSYYEIKIKRMEGSATRNKRIKMTDLRFPKRSAPGQDITEDAGGSSHNIKLYIQCPRRKGQYSGRSQYRSF
jgi:hypothetical protein